MEIRTTDEAKKNIETFTERWINLLLDKKKIDADIKELKNEYKEEGVPVQIVCSTLNRIKALKKKSDSQIFEEETIQTWLGESKVIDDKIGELIAKD